MAEAIADIFCEVLCVVKRTRHGLHAHGKNRTRQHDSFSREVATRVRDGGASMVVDAQWAGCDNRGLCVALEARAGWANRSPEAKLE
jgi:hypothetical protein